MTALVTLTQDRHATTTSLVVAEKFGKNHRDVLKAVRNLECSPEFNQRNFALVDYIDGKGEKRPMYEITKNGFAFLAMGFTGPEAARWKEAFINAFDALESAWRESPLAQLALRELRVRERAKGQPPACEGYVRGMLNGGHILYLNVLEQAEKLLDDGWPAHPVPYRAPPKAIRKLKPGTAERILRDLNRADDRRACLKSHARQMHLTSSRLYQLLVRHLEKSHAQA